MFKANALARGLKNYYLKRVTKLKTEEGSKLPESYKKFYTEWKYEKAKPVHYIEEKGKYKLNEQGRIEKIVNLPIPVRHAPEQDQGIWGGESIIQGFRRPAHKYETMVPEFWVPRLLDQIVYSEILNKYLNVTVTQRTINLINENYGFDNYLLSTKACDLNSLLACKIKKKILQTLYDKDNLLYVDNIDKKNKIYNKYKHYLNNYTKEDIEWYGLSYEEAVMKYNQLNKYNIELNKIPLKILLRKKYVNNLNEKKKSGVLNEEIENDKNNINNLIRKFNPFAKVKELKKD